MVTTFSKVVICAPLLKEGMVDHVRLRGALEGVEPDVAAHLVHKVKATGLFGSEKHVAALSRNAVVAQVTDVDRLVDGRADFVFVNRRREAEGIGHHKVHHDPARCC